MAAAPGSIAQVNGTLAELEHRLQAEPAIFRRRGGIRGRIALETGGGASLGTIHPAWLLASFHYRAPCAIGGADLVLATRGVFRRTYTLLAGDTTLVSVRKPLLLRRGVLIDWEGRLRRVRQVGPFWSRRVLVAAEGGGPWREVVRFRARNPFFKTAVSLAAATGLPPGLSAGAAVLLYYNWYLWLRSAIFAGAAGSGGR